MLQGSREKKPVVTKNKDVELNRGHLFLFFFFLIFLWSTYLFERQCNRDRDTHTQRSSICLFWPQQPQEPDLGQAETKNHKLYPNLPRVWQKPKHQVETMWVIFLCLPRHISSNLDQKYSCQDLNWYSATGCGLANRSLLPMLQCQLPKLELYLWKGKCTIIRLGMWDNMKESEGTQRRTSRGPYMSNWQVLHPHQLFNHIHSWLQEILFVDDGPICAFKPSCYGNGMGCIGGGRWQQTCFFLNFFLPRQL